MRNNINKKLLGLLLFSLLFLNPANAQQNTYTAIKTAKPMYGGYIGLGYNVLSGNLSEYFKNPFSLPITIDFVYKRLGLQMNLDGAWGKIKKTMVFEDSLSWNKGDNAFHSGLGFNIGFSVYNSKKLRITPIAGYSFNYISKKWWNSSDISKYEPESNVLNIGLLFDFKEAFMSSAASTGVYDQYAGLRISAGVYLPLSDNDMYPQYYDGSMIYLSFGIVALSFFN